MAANAPSKDAKSAGPQSKLPPEEKFWKRYSPHGEAPLSVAGSFAVHALGVGGMILFAVYIASYFFNPTRSLPVEPVRLAMDKPGGGGPRDGGGGNKGVGVEDVGDKEDLPSDLKEEPKRPALSKVEVTQIAQKFDEDATRFISESKSDSTKAFARLNDNIRRKLTDGLNPDKGKGGPGSKGGMGPGDGSGTGTGKNEGKSTLTKREKRMLRWHMRFTANTGPEYLQQLKGLGAILAFPIGDGPEPTFKVVRDLRPGAQLLDEDVAKLQRIYWIDDKPRSVFDILTALNIKMAPPPDRFVAFMPESLEQKLYDMERSYVERVLRKKFDEDAIDETNFRVVLTPRGFQPELVSVMMR